ncbi:hypothetical protein ACTI_44290 [Actinoplanes sp. OR16]|uniref:Ig-like domain-containing protein n=1 Tax=Actinoplanes sp. OR16 TaxID=946334 RepID=UPI000F6ED17C|nr:Ig-like domain-containing protein [Actinoplanes sp. OR16]BBH67744.1 hypothetical protein ACTI_44290 [Actinoplanes sp. OR16]
MRHHSIFRWVLGGLTATALSITGLGVPAYGAGAPVLVAGGSQQSTVALGERFDVTLSVTNTGDTAADGVVVTFDTVWAFEDAEQFSNCEYDGGLIRACVFDQTLAPGASSRLVVPFRVRADTYAPKEHHSYFYWKPAAGHVSRGTPGTGPALRLQEGARIGESADGESQEFVLSVPGNQSTDLVAIGDTPAGWVGDVVEAEVGVRNNGPATIDFSRSDATAALVFVYPPSGTSIVSAPECPNVTATRAVCFSESRFKVGEVMTWKVVLRIDSVGTGAPGSVVVNPDCTCDGFRGDIDYSNNTAPLTVEASVDETKPVIEDAGLDANQTVPHVVTFRPRVTDNATVTKVEVTGAPAIALSTCTPQASSDLWSCTVTQQVGDDTEAANVLTVRAYDVGGNVSAPVSVPVRVDRKSPRYTVSPAPQSTLRSGAVTVKLNDVPADVTEVRVLDSRTGALVTTLTAAPWTYTWNATAGATPPAFLAVDRVGNRWRVNTGYAVDDKAPVIARVDFAGAYSTNRLDTGAGWVGGVSTLKPTVQDTSAITRTEWKVDGVLKSRSPVFSLDARGIAAASATVQLQVWDAAGNTSVKAFKVGIDKTGPKLTVAPGHNALIRGSSYVTSLKASDAHGVAVTNLAGRSGSASWVRMSSGKDGAKKITWVAVDKLGNAASASRTVIVDNTAPTLSITKAPKNKAKLTKKVAIAATVSDRNGVAKVQLLVNGKVVATDAKTGYRFTLNPKKYGKTFKVQLRAYDKAGNVRYSAKRTYRR